MYIEKNTGTAYVVGTVLASHHQNPMRPWVQPVNKISSRELESALPPPIPWTHIRLLCPPHLDSETERFLREWILEIPLLQRRTPRKMLAKSVRTSDDSKERQKSVSCLLKRKPRIFSQFEKSTVSLSAINTVSKVSNVLFRFLTRG